LKPRPTIPPRVGYVFDPETLHEIVREVVGQPMETLLPELVDRLDARFRGHVDTDLPWVFNNAGGAMGAMAVLHASITEYLIVFGTPIGTEGHTGRFIADDFFFILEGEQWAYTPGDLRRQVFRPGDMHHLPRGVARGYRIPEHCWALEYARGLIPSMLPFGFADALSSTLDWRTAVRTLHLYTRSAVRQLARGKI
jgi:C-8 sterol isomerase